LWEFCTIITIKTKYYLFSSKGKINIITVWHATNNNPITKRRNIDSFKLVELEREERGMKKENLFQSEKRNFLCERFVIDFQFER
jgi:hypothetical protein